MNIQCIALDLDRTTLNAQGQLSEENRKALEEAIEQGVHVVIASGRSFSTLPKAVLGIPGIEYAITSNGAAVYQVSTGRRLHGYTLPEEAVKRILQETAEERVAYEAFVEGVAYASVDYIQNPVKYGATPEAVVYVQRTRHLVEDIHKFILENCGHMDSMDIVVGTEADKQRIWKKLQGEVPGIYITSSVQQLLEISHQNAGKHNGLRYVTERLGVDRANVAAFGDGDNDVDMLRFAGCGIAVANASPACLMAADMVTDSFQENGVANGIRMLLRQSF